MGCCGCEESMTYHAVYKNVYSRMQKLMPGWFSKLQETMDPDGPYPYVRHIARIVDKTGENVDNVIHREMYEKWFQYHDDYEETMWD